jgi:hypothetical protein
LLQTPGKVSRTAAGGEIPAQSPAAAAGAARLAAVTGAAGKMKNILFFSVLAFAFLFISGCDLAYNENGNNAIPVANIRSAASDPVADCAIEEVHQHNGVYYAGHYNNDGHGHRYLQADYICTESYCYETGLHCHNGIPFAGNYGQAGYGCCR